MQPAQGMKVNHVRVEKLIWRLQDLVGIIAGQIKDQDAQAKIDMKELHGCVSSQLNSDGQPS